MNKIGSYKGPDTHPITKIGPHKYKTETQAARAGHDKGARQKRADGKIATYKHQHSRKKPHVSCGKQRRNGT